MHAKKVGIVKHTVRPFFPPVKTKAVLPRVGSLTTVAWYVSATMIVSLCTAVLALALLSDAYPTGPPSSTCPTLFPKHGVEQQTGVPPYRLVLSSNTYTPGQTITVRLESTTNERPFKGFQVTAHRESANTEDFIGTFNASQTDTQVIACLGQPQKMFGHSSGDLKTSVNASWTAPANNVGPVQFFATVVETHHKIWYKINATLGKPDGAITNPGVPLSGVTPMPAGTTPNWNDCGLTKGCFLVPKSGSNNCAGSDCLAAVSYRNASNGLVNVEMAVEGQNNYLSVGWSDDLTMSDDQTVICLANQGHESVQLGYNPGYYNEKQYSTGLSNLYTKQQDGKAYCSFTRQSALSSLYPNGTARPFDISTTPYHLFLAWGHIFQGTDAINKHTDKPAITKTKLLPTSVAKMVHNINDTSDKAHNINATSDNSSCHLSISYLLLLITVIFAL